MADERENYKNYKQSGARPPEVEQLRLYVYNELNRVAHSASSAMEGVLGSMRFRGTYDNDGTTCKYLKNDVVYDEGYIGIALVDCPQGRPAPQPVGDELFLYSGASPTSTESASQLTSGNRYLFQTPILIETMRVFTDPGNTYQVVIVSDPEGAAAAQELTIFEATVAGWTPLDTVGQLMPAGVAFDLSTLATPATAPADILHMEDGGYWDTAGQPDISGVYALDATYPDEITNRNAYGTDFSYRVAEVSEDWYAIPVGGGGGSSSGGGEDFEPETFAGAGTTGYVPDPGSEQNFFLSDDGDWKPVPVSPIGGLFLNMRWSTNTTVSDPGSGFQKVNNADQTLATIFSTSQFTRPGADAGFIWENVVQGDYLGVWETSGDAESVYYAVTGPPVDQGDWWEIPVAYISGGGGLDNNRNTQQFFIGNPAARIPPGGNEDDVLTKQSDVDYDTYWNPPSGGGGAGQTEWEITQDAHGFAVGDCVAYSGTAWVKAQANAIDTTANGVVVAVANANTCTIAQAGRYALPGLTPDEWYYLSAETAGALTTVEPAISQPIVYSEDGQSIIIYPYRPSYNKDSTQPIPGEIKAFAGDPAALPFGWHLCDGTNGTPDYRGRQLTAAGPDYIDGETGGTFGGASNDAGSHNHGGNTDSGGAHAHTIGQDGSHSHNLTTILSTTTGPTSIGQGPTNTEPNHNHGGATGNESSHTHPINSAGQHSHTTPESPYAVVTGWIMYTGLA